MSSEAFNFDRSGHAEHADRYNMAEEFVDVVSGLWDSCEYDAFPADPKSGLYVDIGRVHLINHKGRYFPCAGRRPWNVRHRAAR